MADLSTQPKIKTEEVGSVELRAGTLGVKAPERVGLLPANFFNAAQKTDLRYQSNALDVKALFKQEGLAVGMIEAEGVKIPFVDDQDATWVGPILFFGAAALSTDPNIVAVALNVLSNYIYHFFRGKEGNQKVRLSLVIEKTDKKRTLKVDFEGPPGDLPKIEQVIKDAFR